MISGIGMPGKGGYFFIPELRKREQTAAREPVVVSLKEWRYG